MSIGYARYYVHQRSGLNLTKYRAYNANLGRWLSRDPLGESAGYNLYAYVDNDPINFIDPSGLLMLFGGVQKFAPSANPCSQGDSKPRDPSPPVPATPDNDPGGDDPDDPGVTPPPPTQDQPGSGGGGGGGGSRRPDRPDDQRYRKPRPGSGKERASDIPSWAKGQRPYVGESPQDFARRLLDPKYGEGNYPKGPRSEFNQLVKHASRGFF